MNDDGRRLTGLLRELRAVRHFLDDPVPDQALAEILEVAQRSGSAQNRQPWEFVTIRSPEMRDRLAGLGSNLTHVARAPVAIAIVMPGERAVLDAFDEGRCVERILLAASALGLGGGLAWLPAEHRDQARSWLGIPEGRMLRSLVAIGHPARQSGTAAGKQGSRSHRSDLVHVEHW